MPIPSASTCCSVYRQLLRSVEQFEDDVCRHVLRHRIRHSFRAHRHQHQTQHERETRLQHERKHAALLVKDRVRWMTASPRPAAHQQYHPPAALMLPPPLPLPEPLVVDSSTAVVSPELRLRIRARFDFAQSSLRTLQQALSADRASRIAVLSFCYTAPSLVSTVMRCRHLHRFMPHLLPASDLAAFHPLHRFLITECQDADWVGVYRLLVAERCRGLDRDWQQLYRQVMAKRAVTTALFEGDRLMVKDKVEITDSSSGSSSGSRGRDRGRGRRRADYDDEKRGDEADDYGDYPASGREEEWAQRGDGERGGGRGGGRGRGRGGGRGRIRPSRYSSSPQAHGGTQARRIR